MTYKIVLTDLDGTILNDRDEIGNRTILLIKRAINMGVKFAMCSSRIYWPTQYYNVQIDPTQPVVTSNGGLITIEDNAIFKSLIASEEIINIIDKVKEAKEKISFSFGDGNYKRSVLYTNQSALADNIDKHYNEIVPSAYKVNVKLLNEPIKLITENKITTYKISIKDYDVFFLKELETKLRKLGMYEITNSEPTNIEITKKGVSKGDALVKLASHYGYSLDECIAIGNGNNDLSMIKNAGLGVAMKNSNSYIKEKADYVTEEDNNNEGVAEVIEKFIL